MDNKLFNRINHIAASFVLAASAIVYLATIEPTTSFWDCGEFIASSYKMEVGHAPGNPAFNVIARICTIFADKDHAALAVNAMSALCSAFTIFFLYLTIVHFGRRILQARKKEMTLSNVIAVVGAGVVGAMAYCFSDTFWFSAVEGEVYAMSSLFTAVVFWAILKWEEQYGQAYANRWLVLICFLMGVSIGVHLLNLLTVPAIVYIFYYKTHPDKVSIGRILGILCISGVILAVILFGIIPYLPQLAAFSDRIFVNGFGARFNVGATVFMVLFLALCFFGLKILRKKEKDVLHTCLLCFTAIVIGYSLFAISVIRSCAGTPTNEYQPDNPYTLIRYLAREQYGSTPIVFGQAFTSPYEVEEKEYYTPLDGKYYKASNPDACYPSSVKMFFPRMWNGNDQRYVNFYKSYCDSYRTKRATIYGQAQNVQLPTFKDNLKFFFDYQVNYMYVRYFLWNFVGRQNDFHGQIPGDLICGNWESGITFLDRLRLGDQSEGPDIFVNNKGKNHYFFLPFILGLIGLFFQIKHDERNGWVTGLLFLLTGLAIVVYLNQPPYQVRERDYAYAGSFYVFALWIGLGVMAVKDWMEKLFKSDGSICASAAVAIGLVVPVLMGCQNWDDHDRSGRYTARDLAYNYLNTIDTNGIIVTHGDNDTFPLWYAQEVEGIRTDVRIVNSSLLGTDWYIDQMKCKFYDSEPLAISIPRKQYLYGTNDFTPVVDAVDFPILASEAIAVFKNPKYVTTRGSDYIPAHNLIIPVNKENVLKYGIVPEKYKDRIADSVRIKIEGDHLSKFDLIMLDVLANYDWSRPIYFVSKGETKLGLDKWLLNEGFCYKFIPVERTEDEGDFLIDEDAMYERLTKTLRFDSMKDTTLYIDYQNIYTFCAVSPVRDIFAATADALIESGKDEKALEVLDKCIEILPEKSFPYNLVSLRSINEWAMLTIVEDYLILGQDRKAEELIDRIADEHIKAMVFYSTPVGPGADDVISKKLSENTAQLYFYMLRICEQRGRKDLADKLQKKIDAL